MRNTQKYITTVHCFLLLCLTVGLTNAQQVLKRERVISPIGSDTRTPVPNALIADKYPFRTVVKLFAYFPDSNVPVQGTGVMVSADGVFTAAHVVYDKDLGGKATKVEIIPGYTDGYRPFKSTYSARIEVPDEYVANEDKDYDFAAILTTTRIGVSSGWLGYGVPTTNTNNVQIIGYPDSFGGRTMVQTTSTATLSGNNELQYDADTSPGMSGAPIITKIGNNDRDYRVIGVHTRGGDDGVDFNFGVRFLDAFLKRFR